MAKGADANALGFLTDFLLGGVSGAIAKTATAPIERVKLVCPLSSLPPPPPLLPPCCPSPAIPSSCETTDRDEKGVDSGVLALSSSPTWSADGS